ncbi:MAG: hypothetical protein HZC40_02925 [Chloroflexi bacterium]|nr:hypothetical protein [Chloroflexota bacterium]
MLNNLHEVEVFFGWIEKKIEEIDTITNEPFRRILLLALLDTLAKSAFPKDKPGKRFVKLIDSYSGWLHSDRVCLIQLRYLLESQVQTECADLKIEVEMRLGKWPPKGIGRIPWSREVDPESVDLCAFKKGRGAALIEKARYPFLLWEMRNFAIHELRTIGLALPDSDDFEEPYYFAPLNLETSSRTWGLNFPTKVISTIVLNCSEKLKLHFEQKGINPFRDFTDEPGWYLH